MFGHSGWSATLEDWFDPGGRRERPSAGRVEAPGALHGRHLGPVGSPRVPRSALLVLDPDRHRGQPLQQAGIGADGPPVVQEHLERAPHRDPAADQQPFAHHLAETPFAEVSAGQVADRDRRCEEHARDRQADAATPKEVAKGPPGRDHADFTTRLGPHLDRLDALGVNYRPPAGPRPWDARPDAPGHPRELADRLAEVHEMTADLRR